MNTDYRSIALRQVSEADLPLLFRLFADPRRSHLWMRTRSVFDERSFYEAWQTWSCGAFGAKFIVDRRHRPIGLVYEYERSVEDGFTKVTALLLEEQVNQGAGVIATALLVDWLLLNLPLRKVYLEVYGYNPRVAGILRKLEIPEEAVLQENRFWNGEYWNLHVFAIERQAWPRIRARILRPQRNMRRLTVESEDIANPVPAGGAIVPRNGRPLSFPAASSN
jgi:RimJ/RimL family protein N-acetyltransferase